MKSFSARIHKLRQLPLAQATRLAVRWAINRAMYRKVCLRRYEALAGDMKPPESPLELEIGFLRNEACDDLSGTSPYLKQADLERFKQQDSTAVVVHDHGRVVASCWMTSGTVYVPELHRHLDVPRGEHLLCRVYVNEEYRGRGLMSHMVYGYAQRVAPSHLLLGHFYRWNIASIRSVEKLGWRHTGDYWTRFVLGRSFPGERHHADRRALKEGSGAIPERSA